MNYGRLYIVPDTLGAPDLYFEASPRLKMEETYPAFIELVALFQRVASPMRLFLVCEEDDTVALDWSFAQGLIFPPKTGEHAALHEGMLRHVEQAAAKLAAAGDDHTALLFAAPSLDYMVRKHIAKGRKLW
jgi:hypothetical protein